VPGMPGIPGMSGPRKQPSRSKKKGGRGVSGNPAKRNSAQQPAASIEPAAASGNGGIDQAALDKAMSEFQLPPELRSRFSK
jgi:signal recognition particle subunit SRP54